jgi:hypothetical protein
LKHIVDIMLVRAALFSKPAIRAMSMNGGSEIANLPEGKVLIPGSSPTPISSSIPRHRPADRPVRHRGTCDRRRHCGFASFSTSCEVHPAWCGPSSPLAEGCASYRVLWAELKNRHVLKLPAT